ncbi:hypothetical protein lbkm_1051 [Lachnospiraceae bacterium KM106-2]|nr:hypothetical protein lbkm_1051 [Lachnospiraceae bacterium KM106-2]
MKKRYSDYDSVIAAKDKKIYIFLAIIFIISAAIFVKLNFQDPFKEWPLSKKSMEIRKDFPDNKAYDMNEIMPGQPCFRDTEQALEQINIDDRKGINKLQKAYRLKELTEDTAQDYSAAAECEATGTNIKSMTPEEEKQIADFGCFMDIFENNADWYQDPN